MEVVFDPFNNCTFFSCTGERNREGGRECEDVCYFDETSSIRFFGLADGQSGKKKCREGGLEVLRAIFGFIVYKEISSMCQCEHIDEIRYKITKAVRERINRLSKSENLDAAEFSSTIQAFAYDVRTGQYILIHLGDGAVIGHKNDGVISMISSPDNGSALNSTWLTTSWDSMNHLRIMFGNINSYKRVLMMTDGASVIARGRRISEAAKEYIRDSDRHSFARLLKEDDPIDDTSCIIIDFDQSAKSDAAAG